MKSKFDPKTYQNKDRVYRPIPGANNILRLWVWSNENRNTAHPSEEMCLMPGVTSTTKRAAGGA